MNIKNFFINLIANIKDGVSRFFISFICSVMGFATAAYHVISESDADEILVPLYMTFGLMAVLSVLLKLIEEYICDKIGKPVQYALCIIAGAVCFILTKTNYESLYMIMTYTGAMIALPCFAFFILMRGDNRDTAFPKVVTSLVFTGAICAVLSGGFSTCIAAFQSLIFSWNNDYKMYLVINLFVWIVGFVNIFLALLPKKDIPVVQSKIFRIFMLFAVMPLYILLIGILLVYLAKIVITRNMPVGEINWFASYASLFFIFILMSVMQYKDKLARWFVKFGGYFLIPVLIMQAIAVFERINAYGLTTPRTVSLTLIVISMLFIAGAIIKPNHLNKIALASGIIVLAVTATPFNVIDMPIASQTEILKTALKNNEMLQNGTVTPKENINEADAERIISAYGYLKYDAKNVPEFIVNEDAEFKDIFGFDNDRIKDDYIYCTFSTTDIVDISDYTDMVRCNSYGKIIQLEHNGQQYDIDLIPVAQSLYDQYGDEDSDTEIELYTINDNIALCFTYLGFSIRNDKPMDCQFNGWVLFKDNN